MPGTFAVLRLPEEAPIPAWLPSHGLVSVTRAPGETSIVCERRAVPGEFEGPVQGGWAAFRLEGPIPFSTTGVVAALTTPLAAARIGVFVLSTFDTDVLLIAEADAAAAIEALTQAGWSIAP